MQLFLKILSEKANSVDPDQTAPLQSDLGQQCLHMPFKLAIFVYEILGHLPYANENIHAAFMSLCCLAELKSVQNIIIWQS